MHQRPRVRPRPVSGKRRLHVTRLRDQGGDRGRAPVYGSYWTGGNEGFLVALVPLEATRVTANSRDVEIHDGLVIMPLGGSRLELVARAKRSGRADRHPYPWAGIGARSPAVQWGAHRRGSAHAWTPCRALLGDGRAFVSTPIE
jgi:hypothetical protein